MSRSPLDANAHSAPALGYRMPAEWAPHRGTWLSWPHKEASWPGKFGPVPGHLRLHGARARRPRGGAHQRRRAGHGGVGAGPARRRGRGRGQRLLPRQPDQRRLVPRSRPDLRRADHGGTPRAGHRGLGLQRLGRQVSAVRSRRRHPDPHRRRARASRVPSRDRDGGRLDRRERRGARCSPPRHVCSIPTATPSSTAPRSRATCATTSACRKILWLGDGIVGDDTDGHVDDLTRFVDERTVVTVVEDDPADENYEPLQENLERLRGMTDQDGRPLRVVTLPMPRRPVPRGPASAGELRQLLHRQRRRARCPPTTRRATRTRWRRCRTSSPAGTSSASIAPIWSGDWAPSTASPSSGRPESGLLPGPHQRRAAPAAGIHARRPAMCSSSSVRLTT